MKRFLVLSAVIVVVAACSADSAPQADDAVRVLRSANPPSIGSADSVEATDTTVAVPTTTISVEFEDEGPYLVTRPVGCNAEPGSPTDLNSEPASWLAFGSYMRWGDSAGCPVRIDVISHIRGAEHCDLQQAEFITLGPSLGEPFSSSTDSRRYVWNGGGVIPGVRSGELLPRSSLQASVRDTGYRQDNSELWLDDADPSVVLVLTADTAKVFRLEATAGLCA